MKKYLVSILALSLLLSACGSNQNEDENDLLNGILDSQGSETEVNENGEVYETPLSEGPTMLPDAYETEEVTTEINE